MPIETSFLKDHIKTPGLQLQATFNTKAIGPRIKPKVLKAITTGLIVDGYRSKARATAQLLMRGLNIPYTINCNSAYWMGVSQPDYEARSVILESMRTTAVARLLENDSSPTYQKHVMQRIEAMQFNLDVNPTDFFWFNNSDVDVPIVVEKIKALYACDPKRIAMAKELADMVTANETISLTVHPSTDKEH